MVEQINKLWYIHKQNNIHNENELNLASHNTVESHKYNVKWCEPCHYYVTIAIYVNLFPLRKVQNQTKSICGVRGRCGNLFQEEVGGKGGRHWASSGCWCFPTS